MPLPRNKVGMGVTYPGLGGVLVAEASRDEATMLVASPTAMLTMEDAWFRILATIETAFDESRIPTDTSFAEVSMAAFAILAEA